MSTLAVNTITNAAGGNTATINGMTPTAQSLQGFRNRIINGNMVIDQRNAGAAVAFAGGNFPVDRMRLSTSGVIATATVQQNLNSITPPAGFQNYIGLSVSSGSATGSSAAGRITQRIEGFNVSDLGFGAVGASTVTLSFWVRASGTGTFGGSLQNSDGNRIYVFSYTINSANTWEYKTVTITGDTSGTWPKTNGIGMLLLFSVGAGSTLQSSAGSWGSTYYDTVTGQVDLLATTGATFYITGVQLEAGSVATPFEQIDYGRELAMCQRYFETGSLASSGVRAGFSAGSRYSALDRSFAVNKRAAPTMGLSGLTYVQASAAEVGVLTQSEFSVSVVVTFANGNYQLSGGLFTASAEL